MPIFTVRVREVHASHMEVEADTPAEAIQKVKDGGGDETMMDYSHTLDPETWDVLDEEGDLIQG